MELWPEALERNWGTGRDILGGPAPGSPEARSIARRQQLSASPAMARATAELDMKIDVRPILSSVRVPTVVIHRAGEFVIRADHGRYLADNIEGARYVELPGTEHFPWMEDMDRAVAEIQEFVTGERPDTPGDRVLATVMFTDLVGSTPHAARVGDVAWRNVLDRHDRLVRAAVDRGRGHYVRSMGDGALATFDGPSRAVRCAKEISEAVTELGLETRIGLHAGEVVVMEDNIGGIAVHIAQRISEIAGPGEVLVSNTVRDLSVGSSIHFVDRGAHDLKGVPDRWQLYVAKLA
jgi:class 3 adenylate cyclase